MTICPEWWSSLRGTVGKEPADALAAAVAQIGRAYVERWQRYPTQGEIADLVELVTAGALTAACGDAAATYALQCNQDPSYPRAADPGRQTVNGPSRPTRGLSDCRDGALGDDLSDSCLRVVHASRRDEARRAADSGDPAGFLGVVNHTARLALVFDAREGLKRRGLYERCPVIAYTLITTHHWDRRVLLWMFTQADRGRLLAAGAPLPGPGPFTLYRGVAGHGPARRVRGLSWTTSLAVAEGFASRRGLVGLRRPAVYEATVPASDVLCWVGAGEHEVIINPPARVRRVAWGGAQCLGGRMWRRVASS